MVQNKDKASHLLSCPDKPPSGPWQKKRKKEMQLAALHTLKHANTPTPTRLVKTEFCHPVPANERNPEACDVVRLITPLSCSCDSLPHKNISASLSIFAPLTQAALLRAACCSVDFLLTLLQPLCDFVCDDPLVVLIFMSYKLLLPLTRASSLTLMSFTQITENKSTHMHSSSALTPHSTTGNK